MGKATIFVWKAKNAQSVLRPTAQLFKICKNKQDLRYKLVCLSHTSYVMSHHSHLIISSGVYEKTPLFRN